MKIEDRFTCLFRYLVSKGIIDSAEYYEFEDGLMVEIEKWNKQIKEREEQERRDSEQAEREARCSHYY